MQRHRATSLKRKVNVDNISMSVAHRLSVFFLGKVAASAGWSRGLGSAEGMWFSHSLGVVLAEGGVCGARHDEQTMLKLE